MLKGIFDVAFFFKKFKNKYMVNYSEESLLNINIPKPLEE